MKPVIVLDANVIVSALFGGIPRKAVLLALRQDVCISPEMESELAALKDKLRSKIPFRDLRYWVQTFLPSLLKKMRRVAAPNLVTICRDPKDDAYLSLAKAAQARYLVTGDKDLLSLSRFELEKAGLPGFKIVSPREFCKTMSP